MRGLGTKERIARDRVLQMIRAAGPVRAADLEEQGISRKHLLRLHEEGFLDRVSRGVYVLAQEADSTECQTLLEAAKLAPKGVICLLSALRFHHMGTQNPSEVWLAIDSNGWSPRVDYPPLRITRMSGEALTDGIEEHRHGAVVLRVFSPAKTVADCFKFRNKVGLEVALEALRDGWRSKKVTMDELWRYAKVDRVANVIRPYLDSLS